MGFENKRVWGPAPAYPGVLNAPDKRIFGGIEPIVIAGPCSIESAAQADTIAEKLAGHGVTFMRGGVYRAGTYPGKKFGLQRGLCRDFARVARKRGLRTIIEVLDIREIEYLDQYADAFQVGARQGQGYALLRELSRTTKPVTIKRGSGMSLDEFLGAAEYLMRGKCQPILIERGGVTNMRHVRWDLSISLIAAVKRMTRLPIIVDASHGTGRRDLVEPMLYAGLAAGADGYLVEVHPNPRMSLSDSEQAFPLSGFSLLNNRAEKVWSRGQAYRKLPADSYTGGDVEVTRRGNIRQLSCGESEITWGKK